MPGAKYATHRAATYGRVVEAGGAVVARQRGAVDDLMLAAGAGEARSTVALVAAESDVTTHGAVHARLVCRAVVQVCTAHTRPPVVESYL